MTQETARYYRRCNVTQFHTHSANTYARRRIVQGRIDRLRADASTPEETEVFLAFLTAAASRYPGSPLETAIPWPTAEDFGIMPGDLEEVG